MGPDEPQVAEHQALRPATARVVKPSQKLQENNSYAEEVARKAGADAAAKAAKNIRKCRRARGRPDTQNEN